MRGWLTIAEPGEPELLLAESSDFARPKVALLMRDLLARFPSTIVGVPVLLFAAPDFEDMSAPWGKCLKLPLLDAADSQPCADLHFLGWAPADTPLPLALPIRAEHYSHEVPWSKPTCVVALFRSHPDVFELDKIELPNQWWGTLFRSVTANIHLSARQILAYPDALECARLLSACARREPMPSKGYFLSDEAWGYASAEAELFKESCRHLFKNVPG